MIAGSASLQGSIKWWSLLHRAHHRFTDTENDPYNARRGFWYAHMGWMMLDQIEVKKAVPMEDLRSNKIIRWQHNQYYWLGPFMSLILPTLICGLVWGDFRGGFYVAGVLRLLFVHHATWCVNSVAHWFGSFTFDDTISPRDSMLTCLFTLGEGYHNFHHEFPNDFRNGIHWWDYDPTKWFISFLKRVGLAYECIEFPWNEILRGETDMEQKKLDGRKKGISYGTPIEALPLWTHEKLQAEIQKGGMLFVIKQVVYDVAEFARSGRHPGGKKILAEHVGTDCSTEFNGGVYNHTNAARNLMCHMRVARFEGELKKPNE
jgi:stearoyl-CoA desaturase (delta-9 desaturase)